MTKRSTSLKKRELVESFMREAILTAAKKVLATHGYDRTSLDQIAAEAQVSKGSIYVYFHSKEELLWEVLKHGVRRGIEAGMTAATHARTPLAKVRAVVHAHLEFFASDRATFKIALTERTNLILNPRGQQIQAWWQMYQEHTDWIGELLQKAIEAGDMRPVTVQRYALMLLDIVFMATYQRLAAPNPISLAQEADEIMDLLLWGLSTTNRPAAKRTDMSDTHASHQ